MTTAKLLTELRAEHARSIIKREKALREENEPLVLFLNGYVAALLFAVAQVLAGEREVTPGYVKEALKT